MALSLLRHKILNHPDATGPVADTIRFSLGTTLLPCRPAAVGAGFTPARKRGLPG